ncbi:hypothetical protein [Rhodopseudomonas pseudopalustris]|uniref:Uncharacterized protein n=2 Tax=Rhodopseudomonas TaxID=1073 RepID=Q13E45_RHOPS|nr:hypothetical protein [Rhodopseudomonas pseudopalustris]ABE37644.1 conserved hypothetical protein [Rhodopseudomonas palustris BisB5]MBB1089977.1 hypothetical protein [Rhodopseudomonas palustris]
MLRFRVLASTLPLLAMGLFARSELIAGPQPCIAVGDHAVQIAPASWLAHLRVGFTEDPARATIRVQIVDSPDAADFAVTDDAGNTDSGACALTPETRLVGIAAHPASDEPLIYLTYDAGGGADYRIFVSSNSFTLRQAAALLVGASDRNAPIATASIGSRS